MNVSKLDLMMDSVAYSTVSTTLTRSLFNLAKLVCRTPPMGLAKAKIWRDVECLSLSVSPRSCNLVMAHTVLHVPQNGADI